MKDARLAVEKAYQKRGFNLAEDPNLKQENVDSTHPEQKPKRSFFGKLNQKKEHLNTSKSSSSVDEDKPKKSFFGRLKRKKEHLNTSKSLSSAKEDKPKNNFLRSTKNKKKKEKEYA